MINRDIRPQGMHQGSQILRSHERGREAQGPIIGLNLGVQDQPHRDITRTQAKHTQLEHTNINSKKENEIGYA